MVGRLIVGRGCNVELLSAGWESKRRKIQDVVSEGRSGGNVGGLGVA